MSEEGQVPAHGVRSDALPIDPATATLLVIDMQKAVCYADGTLAESGVDTAPAMEIIPRVRRLVEVCQDAGVNVVWSKQWHYAHDAARAARILPNYVATRKRVAFQRGSYDAEIVDELTDLITPETELIEKHRWSCFHGTRLLPLLRILGTRVLIIAGVATNTCVETTARDAFMHEYDVVLVRDCIAGVRRDWHESALEVLAFYVGQVVELEVLEDSLDAARAR